MIVVAEVTEEGGACPYQVEGKTDKGERVYARYRSGYLRVEVNGKVVLAKQVGKDQNDDEEIERLRKSGCSEESIQSTEQMLKLMREHQGYVCFDGFMDMDQLRKATEGEIQWPN